MKKSNIFKLLVITGVILFTSACEENPVIPPEVELKDNRVFVTNEGPFQDGTGTLSIIYRDSVTVENNVFEKVNNRPIGNIVQSIEDFNEKVYIVVNNANRIEVADIEDLTSIGVIEGLTSPRYFLGINSEEAYVSCMDNTVAVVDLTTNTVSENISTGTGPERMLLHNNKAFVLNLGGFSVDSTISVINTDVDTVSITIVLAPKPSGICKDKNENIWVICSGKGWNGWPQAGDSEGHLFCINPDDNSILKDISFPSVTEHPEKLIINATKDVLYYIMPDGIYKFEINANELSSSPLISSNIMFYGIGYDVQTEYIYASDARDYVQNGSVYRYKAEDGIVVDSFEVGVGPNGFCFN